MQRWGRCSLDRSGMHEGQVWMGLMMLQGVALPRELYLVQVRSWAVVLMPWIKRDAAPSSSQTGTAAALGC